VFLQRVIKTDENREWADQDDLQLVIHIQRSVGIARITREMVAQAVIACAHQNQRHCVRDWMDSLEHDGTPRIDQFFSDHFGTDGNAYTQAVSRNFWLSMVARAYRPGCKVDNMVILEGAQGIGKSQALQAIGGDWFAEMHESATNPKGFAEILQGKLLIEITEMDSFNRAEVNRVKQTISCPSDRYRPSYGHHAQDHKRQCIFVGTTNRDDWNRDETGARRFWPIACRGSVQLDAVRANRTQLFAEAVKRYKAGEKHWEMPSDETVAEQSARFLGDPWLDAIEGIIKGESSTTTAHVAEKLGIPLERRDRANEMRIAASLRHLGWNRKRGRVRTAEGLALTNHRAYIYSPGGDGGDSEEEKPFK
jgi:predicted P-loop ATPase